MKEESTGLSPHQRAAYRVFDRASFSVAVLMGPDLVIEYINECNLATWQRDRGQVLGKPLFEANPEISDGAKAIHAQVYQTGNRFEAKEVPIRFTGNGSTQTRYFDAVIDPVCDDAGEIAGQMAISIDVTEKVLARRRAEESEERYATTVHASDLGLWDFDVLNQTVTAAGRMAHIYGLASNNDYTMEQIFRSIHPDHVAEQQKLFADIVDGKVGTSFETEYRIVKKDSGEMRWIRAKVRAFFNEAGVMHRTVGTVADITERKAAEVLLRQSEEEFRNFSNKIQNLAWMADGEGWIYWYNQRWYDYTGTTLEEMEGWGWEKVHHPDHVDRVFAYFKETWKRPEPCKMTFPLRGADGVYRWFLTRAEPVLDQEGKITRWIGTNTNINAQKLLEETLIESERQLQFAIDATGLGVWDYNPATGTGTGNRRLKEWFGLQPDDEVVFSQVLDVIAEKDRNRVRAAMNSALQGHAGGEYNIAYALIHPQTGHERIVKAKGKASFNENGVGYRLNDTLQDITAEETARLRIKESENRFRTLAETLPQMIWVADDKLQNEYASGYWQRYAGIGDPFKAWEYMIHPDDRQTSERVYAEAYAGGQPFEYEVRLRNREGVYHWHLSVAHPVKDQAGTVLKWIGSITDIHDRKMLTRQLESLVKERTLDLERSNEDLQQFAHVASHDLKEPLRKIKLFAGRVENECGSALSVSGQTHLQKIIHAAGCMQAMIDGVLAYSSLNATGKGVASVNLDQIIGQVETELEVLIAEKQARILHDPLPVIEGTPVLLYQLFYNLVSNALKFSRPGTAPLIQIRLDNWASTMPWAGTHESDAAQTISLQNGYDGKSIRPDGIVRISVWDNGIGFEAGQSENIFGPFIRLHSKDTYEGTGLGLTLCRKIV